MKLDEQISFLKNDHDNLKKSKCDKQCNLIISPLNTEQRSLVNSS
jgi:hypothetical protein